MRVVVICLSILLGSTSAFAGGNKIQSAEIKVKGVCGMCEDRIEEAANLSKGVKSSSWNKETQILTVTFNPKKTNAMKIGVALAEAGHDNQYRKATDKQYSKIHRCCRYREMKAH